VRGLRHRARGGGLLARADAGPLSSSHSTGRILETINLPTSAGVRGWSRRSTSSPTTEVQGRTVYRDGCRAGQPWPFTGGRSPCPQCHMPRPTRRRAAGARHCGADDSAGSGKRRRNKASTDSRDYRITQIGGKQKKERKQGEGPAGAQGLTPTYQERLRLRLPTGRPSGPDNRSV